MNKTTTIRLDDETEHAIRQGDIAAVEKTLSSNITNSEEDLETFLQDFCINIRETYSLCSLIVDCVDSKDLCNGTLSISFVGDAYMGCKDADYLHDHEELLDYEIDVASKTITLSGEFTEEREPDEY